MMNTLSISSILPIKLNLMNILLDLKKAEEIAQSYQYLIEQKLELSPYDNAVVHSIEPTLVKDSDYKIMVKAAFVIPPMMPELTQEPEYRQVEIDLFDVIFIKRLPILFDIDDILLAKN